MISEHQKEINRRSYAKHVEKRRSEARECQRKKKEEGIKRGSLTTHRNWETFKERQRDKNALLRAYVIEQYGNKCTCCGESRLPFLDLDHVNDDGKHHRESLGNPNIAAICRWVIRNQFPTSLQVLCSNCNQGKRRNGGVCPHKCPPVVTPLNLDTASAPARRSLVRFLKSVELGCSPRFGLPGIVSRQSKRGGNDDAQAELEYETQDWHQ